jgi:hypothetical protein
VKTAFELQIAGDDQRSPLVQSLWMFFADLLAAFIPVIPFAFFSLDTARIVSISITAILLLLLGVARDRGQIEYPTRRVGDVGHRDCGSDYRIFHWQTGHALKTASRTPSSPPQPAPQQDGLAEINEQVITAAPLQLVAAWSHASLDEFSGIPTRKATDSAERKSTIQSAR